MRLPESKQNFHFLQGIGTSCNTEHACFYLECLEVQVFSPCTLRKYCLSECLGLSNQQVPPGIYMLPQVLPGQVLGKAKAVTGGLNMPLYLNSVTYKQQETENCF